jgi:hypothetical protein
MNRLSLVWILAAALGAANLRAQDVAPLPDGVTACWDLSKAFHEATGTRERICINGLWRWQPAEANAVEAPEGRWGYFKVPGCWPGITDYMQKDSQTVFSHPSWKDLPLGEVTAAWYEREVTVPAGWKDHRLAVCIETLNSYAAVFCDGKRIGELRFPGGELDCSAALRPGVPCRLSLLVVALPLKAVMQSYTDTAAARQVRGSVSRRGLCGDVWLTALPGGARVADVRVETSVRRKTLTVDAAIEGPARGQPYSLRARVSQAGRLIKEFTSRPFQDSDLQDGRIACAEPWMPDRLWDIHTPENTFDLEVSLLGPGGRVLDTAWTVRSGFREFWIEGRDFFLNGSRLFLSALPFDNPQVSTALASAEGCRESLERLKGLGINLVYTHNYGCEPGSHLAFSEMLRVADDVGMLVSFSQPHFSHYEWQAPDADRGNGYARHAESYVRAAQNHPAVVMYSMSHNATGYNEDINPDLIDGVHDSRDGWAQRNVKTALRAEAIVRRLDPSRIVYHHASGNLGPMHVVNFYPNFVPIQELSDWFEHWATSGTKPVFLCEYGAPFSWDWMMYRGWYKGKREFGSALVPWEMCLAEWNAQFLGDTAYTLSDGEKANLRWEARQFQEARLWHRWDYPHPLGSSLFTDQQTVLAAYTTDNWRAHRTWGLSANSPWEHGWLFTLRPGVARNRRQEMRTDWLNLQRPGYSPDFQEQRFERMDLAYDRSDWVATEAGRALIRNNQPLLAYIAGRPGAFTSKDHLFTAGQTVEKQLIVINNSRITVTCEASWSVDLPQQPQGQTRFSLETGQQRRIPIAVALQPGTAAGTCVIAGRVSFDKGQPQEDRFVFQVVADAPAVRCDSRIAVYDPKGQTLGMLKALGLSCQTVDEKADLAGTDVLIVGKAALAGRGPAPDISRVRDGLRVLVFEQTPEALEKRLGFRVAEYGLRRAFVRIPDHPALAGLHNEDLRDWRGEATILPPRLTYTLDGRFNGAPTVSWCGLPVTRLWRCGCRGSVASVLIEKPARGDFLPIVDGGFNLQYSPLLEYREGRGMVLFCQMDVTGRTEPDPASQTLVANLLTYVDHWRSPQRREAIYAGDAAGRTYLQTAGLSLGSYDGGDLRPDQVLILGSPVQAGGPDKGAISRFLNAGGGLLAIGLGQEEMDKLLSFKVTTTTAETFGEDFASRGTSSLLAGIGPGDVHLRDPRPLPLISAGLDPVAGGLLATAPEARAVVFQWSPWRPDVQADAGLRRTLRRTGFAIARLLANLGAAGRTPLLSRFSSPVGDAEPARWLSGLYLDEPQEWDDPYRFFRW